MTSGAAIDLAQQFRVIVGIAQLHHQIYRLLFRQFRLFDIFRETLCIWFCRVYRRTQEYSKNDVAETNAVADNKIMPQLWFGGEKLLKYTQNTTV